MNEPLGRFFKYPDTYRHFDAEGDTPPGERYTPSCPAVDDGTWTDDPFQP